MSGQMSDSQLIQQVALLQWLSSQSEVDLGVLRAVTGVQVCRELLDRLSGRRQVEALKRSCILGISQFVRENPGASEAQISAEVEKQVLVFAAQVQALERQPLF